MVEVPRREPEGVEVALRGEQQHRRRLLIVFKFSFCLISFVCLFRDLVVDTGVITLPFPHHADLLRAAHEAVGVTTGGTDILLLFSFSSP